MSRYLSEMKARGIELTESLFPHHQTAAIADLKRLGKKGWHIWLEDNSQECLDYLQATPASRKKKKWTSDTQNHRRLILGALVFHRAAVLFQEIWEQHGDCTGLGYRDAHKEAAIDGWNAIKALQRFSYYPLDFLDELHYQAEGVYKDDLAWPSFSDTSDAPPDSPWVNNFADLFKSDFKFKKD